MSNTDTMIPTNRPARFSVKEALGTSGGGMNGGIAVVKDRGTGIAHIEKIFSRIDIRSGVAQREIEYLQQLSSHSHITRMAGSYIDPSKQEGSIFMEFCSLGSLEKLIQRHAETNEQRIGEHYLWMWFIQITDALSFCYNGPSSHPLARREWNFIIHRDIKPANILLTRAKDGDYTGLVVAKVADFGCAISKREFQSGEAKPWKQSKYTELFQPPESPSYSQASDIWQLGVVMICLCNLKHDWQKVHRWETRPASGYSDELNEMILRCIERNPRTRIRASELKYQLNISYDMIRNRLPSARDLILPIKRGSQHRA